jgi:pimeloyl-ACP methyl ester carboxylesterase
MSEKEMPEPGLRRDVHQLLRFFRRLEGGDPQEPLPPPVPDGRVVNIEQRGEMFVREAPGAEGGPTVVLLHGWTLSADLNWFSGIYEVAARHGRVLAPDVRGHGRGLRSEKPFTLEAAADDVAALIEELDGAPAVLVGYSMGGSLALLIAGRHPELVGGLVLVSTGLLWRASLRDRVMWMSMAAVEYGLRLGAPRGLTERYLRYTVEQAPDIKPYLGWIKAEVRRGDPADIGYAGKALASFDARQLAHDVDVPTAVVVTCRDRLIRGNRQYRLAEAIEGAEVIEVDGAHNAWLVRPTEFATAIDAGLEVVIERSHKTGGDAAHAGRAPDLEQVAVEASRH